jgi:hypothetical protein
MSDYQARFYFNNGFGASVICHEYSYGGKNNLFEVAVLKDNALCYTTPITDDVVGHLDFQGVADILKRIETLPKENK